MSRMRYLVSVVVAGSLILAAGCTVGQGPVVDETREVAAFDRIEAGAGIHVEVSIGSASSLEVHAQQNLLSSIATEVRGGTLTVEAVDNITSSDAVVVAVVATSLEAVSLSGGAVVVIEGLDASAIEIDARGGSRVTVAGGVNTVELLADGGSSVDLAHLEAGNVELRLDGAADARVRASDGVTGSVSGGAHLTVLGDAEVAVETSGGGQVARE